MSAQSAAMIRKITTDQVTAAVAQLCQRANFFLGQDVLEALRVASRREESAVGLDVLETNVENAELAANERVPLCQDCGFTVVFLDVGQDVHITGGSLAEAIQAGVRSGYRQGLLRGSIVARPFTERVNTGDNTPAVIHTEIVPGDQLRIRVLTKGGGSENMSRLAMLKPSDGRAGVIRFVLETVELAGPNACPPIIVGVGVGGTFDHCAYLAKKAILREVGQPSNDPDSAALEAELLTEINNLGIGPMGLGGRVTALVVHVEAHPSHIASLPVAVNIQCHSARLKEIVL